MRQLPNQLDAILASVTLSTPSPVVLGGGEERVGSLLQFDCLALSRAACRPLQIVNAPLPSSTDERIASFVAEGEPASGVLRRVRLNPTTS